MKHSFFFDTDATANAGGNQETTEQLQGDAAAVSTESQVKAEGEDENDGEDDA